MWFKRALIVPVVVGQRISNVVGALRGVCWNFCKVCTWLLLRVVFGLFPNMLPSRIVLGQWDPGWTLPLGVRFYCNLVLLPRLVGMGWHPGLYNCDLWLNVMLPTNPMFAGVDVGLAGDTQFHATLFSIVRKMAMFLSSINCQRIWFFWCVFHCGHPPKFWSTNHTVWVGFVVLIESPQLV